MEYRRSTRPTGIFPFGLAGQTHPQLPVESSLSVLAAMKLVVVAALLP
jgi:hypothetical protein